MDRRDTIAHEASTARQLGAMPLLLGLFAVALLLAHNLTADTRLGDPPGATAIPRLLIAEPQAGGRQTLRPVDPLTLADFPAYSPIAIGARRWQTPSPDGATLALFVEDDWPAARAPGAARTSRLQLLDLATWHLRPTPIVVSGEIGWAGFARDGRTLYWLAFGGGLDTAPQGRAHTLYRYRPGDAEAEALTTLPPGLIGEEIRQSRSGRELILYRVPEGSANPQLIFLDLASGQRAAMLPLTTLCATPPGANEGCHPGLAWDLPRDRLYIAHAENEAITVIDLAMHAVVRQGAIEGPISASVEGEHIFTYGRALTVGTQRYRFLTIDSSGTRLIIGSRTSTVESVAADRWRGHDRRDALRTLDAATFRIQGELPIDSMLIAATKFGILTQSVRFAPGGASIAPGDFRLRLWDAGDLREVWQRDTAPGDIWGVARSPDNRLAYMMRPNAAEFFRGGAVVPDGQGNTFGVYDFSTKQLIAARRIPGGSLIPLWTSP